MAFNLIAMTIVGVAVVWLVKVGKGLKEINEIKI